MQKYNPNILVLGWRRSPADVCEVAKTAHAGKQISSMKWQNNIRYESISNDLLFRLPLTCESTLDQLD